MEGILTQRESDLTEEKELLIAVGERNLERVHDWVKTADQKAGFTLTISIALLGASLAAIQPATETVIVSASRGQVYWTFVALLCATFAVYVTTAIRAIWLLIKVVKPRTTPTTKRQSPLFFGTIADMELEVFKARMCSIDCEDLLDEISDQTYIAAEIAVVKYNNLNLAFDKLVIAVIAGLLFVGITYIASAIVLS